MQEIQQKLTDVPVENPRGVRPVYTNSANVTITNWDVQFLFTELSVRPDGKGVTNEICAHIVMTPGHAVAFYEVMKGMVEELRKKPSSRAATQEG